ncbi:MAG: hypothetical protein WEC12_03835 [Balneolaceae bacterium]
MGRAMLIICAGALLATGIMNISTMRQGKAITENTVNYADFIMAKNAAQTAIQMAMQEINADSSWADLYDELQHQGQDPDEFAWKPVIDGREVTLFTRYIDKDPDDYFSEDRIRLISNAVHNDISVEVNSLYLMQPFSALVPDFDGALQLPTDIGEFSLDGTAHGINGTPPAGHGCSETKPPVAVKSEETKQKIEAEDPEMDGEISVDSSLSYEPTDELIERLYNSGNSIKVDGDYSSQLGTAQQPGVFFIDGNVKLTGQQSEGYGIMVIRSGGSMEYEDGSLSVAGNFEFNGLIIFENAFDFDGRGTPTINGSVLIGNTPGYLDDPENDPIDISLGGNIEINYDCLGEKYAKMAAADAVKQNKYTRVVTTEGANYGL